MTSHLAIKSGLTAPSVLGVAFSSLRTGEGEEAAAEAADMALLTLVALPLVFLELSFLVGTGSLLGTFLLLLLLSMFSLSS